MKKRIKSDKINKSSQSSTSDLSLLEYKVHPFWMHFFCIYESIKYFEVIRRNSFAQGFGTLIQLQIIDTQLMHLEEEKGDLPQKVKVYENQVNDMQKDLENTKTEYEEKRPENLM